LIVNYAARARMFKALSDPNRLMIVDMLSCGELCACVILGKFHITQPTLSHHMKTLCDCQLVNGRKEGKWIYYSLNEEVIQEFKSFLDIVTTAKEDCICNKNDCHEETNREEDCREVASCEEDCCEEDCREVASCKEDCRQETSRGEDYCEE